MVMLSTFDHDVRSLCVCIGKPALVQVTILLVPTELETPSHARGRLAIKTARVALTAISDVGSVEHAEKDSRGTAKVRNAWSAQTLP